MQDHHVNVWILLIIELVQDLDDIAYIPSFAKLDQKYGLQSVNKQMLTAGQMTDALGIMV